MNLISNFEATQPPVDPSKLRVRGGRKVTYNGEDYHIKSIDKSTRKDKKYVATVENKSAGTTHKVHWGNTNYDDYYVHKDKKRRKNFQSRHGAIKLKDGRVAADDPRQAAYYATKANWSYMGVVANFEFRDENGFDIPPDDAPIVKRLGRFRNLKSPNQDSKPKRRLSTAELIDLQNGGIIP